jgi:hypothetical protein
VALRGVAPDMWTSADARQAPYMMSQMIRATAEISQIYESVYKKEPQLLPMAIPRRWVYFSAAIEGAHGLAPMARARAA